MDETESMWQGVVRRDNEEIRCRLPGEGVRRFDNSIRRAETGSQIDLRTPFHKEESRSEVLAELKDKLGVCGNTLIQTMDEAEEKKVGCISWIKPGVDRLPGLLEYWRQSWNPEMQSLRYAIAKVKSLVPRHSVRALSAEAAYKIVEQHTQSLGLPWLGRDKTKLRWYKDYWEHVSDPSKFFPCMWYVRCQANGSDVDSKNRDVWGYSHGETCGGQRFVRPLIDTLRELSQGFSAWRGFDGVDVAISKLLKRTKGMVKHSMDFHGFDKTISGDLLHIAEEIMMEWMEPSIAATIALVVEVEKTVAIVTPYGTLSGRSGGMPSGSVATNLIDTIINLLVGFYVAHRAKSTLQAYEVMGDDSVYVWNPSIEAEVVSNFVQELGLESNPEKQFISREAVHFLQRIHQDGYVVNGLHVGVRSIYRACSGLLGQETVKPYNHYMYSARLLSQLQQCCFHPLFEPFVRYWYEADENLVVGIDPVDIMKRAGGSSLVREAIGSASFQYNSVDPQGVNGWQVTQVIRTLQAK